MATTNGKKTESRFQHPYGYDALYPNGKRRSSGNQVYREDQWTRDPRHTALQASAADLSRNMSLAAWMVRRHLDYVATFEFKSRTENKSIDDQIEALMLEDSRKSVFDIAGKFNREKMFRLAEMRRVFDGDTLLIKMADGRIQGLQADLLKNPPDLDPQSKDWINGIRVNRFGRTMQFGIYGREGYTGREFVRIMPAANVIHYGFFERYAQDQVRGVSPLVAALNPLRDVYDNFNFALLKAKVSQLFALAFYRDAEEGPLAADDDLSGVDDVDGDHYGEPRGFQAFMKSDTRYVDLDPGEVL
jgi:capsid protein